MRDVQDLVMLIYPLCHQQLDLQSQLIHLADTFEDQGVQLTQLLDDFLVLLLHFLVKTFQLYFFA